MDVAEGNLQQDIAPPGASTQESQIQEKMLKQSDVNELIGKARHAGYEKGMREAQGSQPQQPPPQSGGQLGGMNQLTEEQVRHMIADEAHKQTQVTAAHELLNNFAQQMSAGKGKYPEFDETVSSLGDLRDIPHIVELATGTGMAGEVMFELGQNPSKVATLTTLAYMNPQLAKAEMKKLADSIKKNESANELPKVDEPLTQVKPSTVAAKDNGDYSSVKDFRTRPWARG
jgi:hypothetical protein